MGELSSLSAGVNGGVFVDLDDCGCTIPMISFHNGVFGPPVNKGTPNSSSATWSRGVAGIGFCGAPRRSEDCREDEDEAEDEDADLGVCAAVNADVAGDISLDEDDDDDGTGDEIDEADVDKPLLVEGIAENSDSDQLSKSPLDSWSDNRGGNAVNRFRSCKLSKGNGSSSSSLFSCAAGSSSIRGGGVSRGGPRSDPSR